MSAACSGGREPDEPRPDPRVIDIRLSFELSSPARRPVLRHLLRRMECERNQPGKLEIQNPLTFEFGLVALCLGPQYPGDLRKGEPPELPVVEPGFKPGI